MSGLTVKFVVGMGKESVHPCDRLEVIYDKNEIRLQLFDPDNKLVINNVDSKVFVMNEQGNTIASYKIGDRNK